MRIDEARDHGAAARVDARRASLDRDAVGEGRRRANVGDAAVERRDDAVLQRGDFALREATAGRRPRARRDEVSVLDQKVRWNHADLG